MHRSARVQTLSSHIECFKDARRDQIIFYATEQDITARSDARTLSSVELNLAEGRKKTEKHRRQQQKR
jgi:hypothetical protein